MEQTTYDRLEATAKNQIYPIIGDRVVGDITATDIKNLLNYLMNKGLAYSTVKKAYVLLNEYFKTLYLEEMINKNPMDIIKHMHHGATACEATGQYTGDGKTMIHTVCRRIEAIKLRRKIKEIDPHAFIIITTSSEIIGRGFRGV